MNNNNKYTYKNKIKFEFQKDIDKYIIILIILHQQ